MESLKIKSESIANWLDTFISEKGLDIDQYFEIDGPSGVNMINYHHVLQIIKSAPIQEQRAIKMMMISLDFNNADIAKYFRHLAQAIAI